MFSMTDIKAHSVYKILMFFPNLILVVLSIFAYPLASYLLGFSFVDSLVLKVVLTLVAGFVLGIAWNYLVKAIVFILNEAFYLIIDVSPSKGLTEEESKAVLFGGQAVLDNWELDRNIRNVSGDVIDRLSRQGLFGFVFKDDVSKRLWAVVDYYQEHPNETVSAYRAKEVVKNLGIAQPWFEIALNNALVRTMILQSIFFIYLLIDQPNF